MLIQTFRGEILSIELEDRKETKRDIVEFIKEKIAEIEPSYTPFGQFLFPLRKGPLRPVEGQEMLGMVQQPVRIRILKPQFRILLSREMDRIDHYVWLLGIRWTRKKGMPKRVQKEVFLYDPLFDRYTLHCGFSCHYHRVNPFNGLVPRTESIEWYSSLEETMRSFHGLFPSTPFSNADMELYSNQWANRKSSILSNHALMVHGFEQTTGPFHLNSSLFVPFESPYCR
jgi:hypothetical protein